MADRSQTSDRRELGSEAARGRTDDSRRETTIRPDTLVEDAVDTDVPHRANHLVLSRDSDRTPTLTVVLPTLNEEAGIAECLTRIKNAVFELQVTAEIIVSDSSTDRTPDIAEAHGAHVVNPDRDGYGYAYRYAFRHARGDYVVIGDADTTYDFEELPKLYEHVANGEADIAMGSRMNGEIRPGAMPRLHRHVGNPLLTKFLNFFYDAGVSDAHSGFRVISRDALDTLELQADGMEFASEMIMTAAVEGLDIVEEPITYHEREGDATLESFHDGWRHVKFMLVNAPTYLFTLPAVGFAVLGAIVMGLSLLGQQFGGITFGVHTIIAGSLLTILGVNIGSLSLFSSIAADPIKTPKDPLVEWVLDNFRLEDGLFLGLVVAGLGSVYVSLMAARWVASGYTRLPFVGWNMVAFTMLVVGVQLMFKSFFFSMLVTANGDWSDSVTEVGSVPPTDD